MTELTLLDLPLEVISNYIIARLDLNSFLWARQSCKKIHFSTESDKLYEKYKDELCPGFPLEKTCRETFIKLIKIKRLKDKLNLEGSILKIYQKNSLFLNNNQLKKLPKEIDNLTNLQELSYDSVLERFLNRIYKLIIEMELVVVNNVRKITSN